MNKPVLFGFPVSANTHRVRLTLSVLGIAFDERTVDLVKGEQREAAFTAINPRQVVPVLDDDGELLSESYAIMLYAVQKYGGERGRALWSDDLLEQARIASWMFYDANELRNGIGLARNERSFGIAGGGNYAAGRGERSLQLLEDLLSAKDWLECGRPTLADISVYPFVAVAPEAGLPLEPYPGILRWIKRLSVLSGFVAMPTLKDLRK